MPGECEKKLGRACLEPIEWTKEGAPKDVSDTKLKKRTVIVQFNPQSLKVSFSSQKSGGDQAGGSAIQFVGLGATTLSLDLWFDVTGPLPEGQSRARDVRQWTREVAYFLKPQEDKRVNNSEDKVQFIPPGVRFIWGNFLFEGVMDSMNETLEFFSEDGRALRASVSIKLSRQEILIPARTDQGTTPAPTPAKAGDTIQKMAAAARRAGDWKDIAAANGVENPRRLEPGAPVDLNAGGESNNTGSGLGSRPGQTSRAGPGSGAPQRAGPAGLGGSVGQGR